MNQTSRALGIEEHPALSAMMMAVCCYLMLSAIWFPPATTLLYDNARVLELMLTVALALLWLLPDARDGLIASWLGLGRGARWCIVLLLGGGAASAAFSLAPQMGMIQLGLCILLVWLFLGVCTIVRKLGRPAETVLAAAVCIGAGLAVTRFWVTFIQNMEAGRDFSWVSPFLEFANVRFFGQYQAYVLLLVALPAALLRLTWSWRIVVYLVAANFWALQWMVGSRAVWIGFAAALAAVSIFMRAGRLRWIGEQGALVLAGGAIYLAFSTFVLSSPNATPIPAVNSIVARGSESASERVTMAKAALRLIGEHPLLGTGPGQFGLHFSATGASHPHDTPLQLVTEYGLPAGLAGVALGAMLIVFAIREIRRRTLRQQDAVGAALTAALVMGLVESLFSGNLIMPHSQVLLCVIAGWVVGRSDAPRHPQYRSPQRMAVIRTSLVGTALLGALITTILAAEYLDAVRNMRYAPELRTPSFWQYGRFTDW